MLGGSGSGSRSSSSLVQQKNKKPIQRAEFDRCEIPKILLGLCHSVRFESFKTFLPVLTWSVCVGLRHDIGVGAPSDDPAWENRYRLSDCNGFWESQSSTSPGNAQD